ncbi:hypothetical protein [Ralstonia wenshanensis]|uniref:hypothetical protein n=1 Tax=Ralstonia wenshanensis TaxID=2842456 RepID=UPI003D9557AA
MTQKATYLQAARVTILSNGYSPLIRGELLSKSDVVDWDGIEVDATITLGSKELSFRSSELFPAITAAYDRVSTPVIETIAGDEWAVTFVGDVEPPNVAFVRGSQRLFVPQFSLLAPNPQARLHAFQLIADQHRLSHDVVDRWNTVLSERMPTDSEITALRGDLQNTPIGAAEALQESLENGTLSLDTLVPRSEHYYRQLVGGGGSATTLEDCIAEVVAPFLANLLAENSQQSLSLAWPLCSHQSVSQVIDREWKGDDQVLADGIAWLVKNGDPISRVGAIEVGLRRVRTNPTLPLPLAELINTLLSDEPDAETSAFELLSSLFNCIYGQMARCRILAKWPPYARRLAALAHASLVGRHVLALVKDRSKFARWLRDANDGYFYMQALLDMRVEPRWFPELGSSEQWKNELLGRVWMAANSAPDAVKALGLTERLISESPQSVIHQLDRPAVHLPGPLEGGTTSPVELSPEITAEVEQQLKAAISTKTFIGLINVSMWLRVPDRLVDLIVEAIERHHYQIPVDEEVPFSSCLTGLASVAAVSRNTKLCEAIHTVLRVSWRLNRGQLTADEMFRAGILACAAHVELTAWTERVGQFMTELSLQNLTEGDADMLQSHLSTMCHLVPELWGTCGQAQAAFGLVIGR